MTSRTHILKKPGLYLDRSATGTGKSTADIEAVRSVDGALIVVPTHENAAEVESDMRAAGIDAKKFPSRQVDGDHSNCWNELADIAETMGLSVVASVCPHCNFFMHCNKCGYLGQIAKVGVAPIAIATHQRAVHNQLNKLAAGREDYIAIHEDSASVMCPDAIAPLANLDLAAVVMNRILNDPKYLDWLGQSARMDIDGNWVPDDQLAERRDRIDKYVRHLADVIDFLIEQSIVATKTQEIILHNSFKKACGTDNLLFRATIETRVKFTSGTWRLLLAAASGELHSIGVIVDEMRATADGSTDPSKRKFVIGNWRNIPSENAVVLFADATTNRDDLESYVGREVKDITPEGHVERSKRVVQFPRDITRETKKNRFLAVIRGVLTEFPGAQRVGVISHRTLTGYLTQLGEPFASRIVKSTYFGSGSDRASNDWYSDCGLIIVAGTPRVPSLAIQQRLIQFGDFGPAGENPDWGEIRWRGQTETGQELIVRNRGYRHPLWAKAYRSLVRAAIIQAAGRGRPILETGCDVVIISTEECGFPLADDLCDQISETELKTLKVLKDLSLGKVPNEQLTPICAKSISKRRQALTSPVTTPDIAQGIGLSESRTRAILAGLESRKLVIRIGDRSGWIPTDHELA